MLCGDQLLTGDSHTRISDTVFNLDMHSPSPNALYRQSHPSPATVTCSAANMSKTASSEEADLERWETSTGVTHTRGRISRIGKTMEADYKTRNSSRRDVSISSEGSSVSSLGHIKRGSSRSRILTPGVDFDIPDSGGKDVSATTLSAVSTRLRGSYKKEEDMKGSSGLATNGTSAASAPISVSSNGSSKGRKPRSR